MTGAAAAGPPGRHQGADRDRPRTTPSWPPRARAGIPLEPWQQVVADAAVGPDASSAVAGTHGKSTTAGWLVHVLVGGRARTRRRFVGALLPAALTGGLAGDRAPGRGRGVRRRGRRVRRQLRCLPARRRRPDQRRVGPPGRLRRPGRGRRRVRGAGSARAAAGRRRDRLVANVGDPGVAELVGAPRATGPGRSSRRARRRRAAAARRLRARRSRERYRDRRRPGDGAARPDRRRGPGRRRRSRSHGLDPLAGPLASACRRPAATTPRTRSASPAAAAALGVDAAAVVGRAGRRSRASAAASSARARPRGVVVYDDYGHHPTAIRETLAAVRQREPGRRVWAVYEPLTFHRTAALLDEFADALAERRRGRDRRHLGRPRPGHDDRLGRPASPRRWPRARPGIPVAAPGIGRGDRRAGSPARSAPGDVVLVMGGGRELPDRRAAARATGGAMTIDYAAAGDLLDALRRAPGSASTATRCVDLFTDDAEYHGDPFGPPLVGHNALRAYLLDAAERRARRRLHRRAPLGRRATTVLAAWHASWTPARRRARGPAGRLPDRRGGGGRADRAPAASGR